MILDAELVAAHNLAVAGVNRQWHISLVVTKIALFVDSRLSQYLIDLFLTPIADFRKHTVVSSKIFKESPALLLYNIGIVFIWRGLTRNRAQKCLHL